MGKSMVKLVSWVRSLIVDPLSKELLTPSNEHGFLVSPYGRKYPVYGDLIDLRLLNNATTPDQKRWKEGQLEYERDASKAMAVDFAHNYEAELESVRDVYENIPVEGRCLDVGGHQGRLRHFLAPGQEYISCDPFINVFDGLSARPNLIKAYPCLNEPMNFICCDAEFLPFRSASFNTVHMRSVIDHFLSPELALNEAYRVLDSGGSLVVGLYVQGGRSGRTGVLRKSKDIVKRVLISIGLDKFRDHHVWHPTYRELESLIKSCGFSIEKVHWQKGHADSVCYIRAIKQPGLMRI